MDKIKSFNTTAKSTFDDEQLIVKAIIGSNGNLDRHGERINPAGWSLENYQKNPVVQVNHCDEYMPPAKAIAVALSGNDLVFDLQFDKNDPIGVLLYNKLKDGYINAFSVGFRVIKFGEEGSNYDYEQQELYELSIVYVPANADAVVVRSFAQENKALIDAMQAKGADLLTKEQKALIADPKALMTEELKSTLSSFFSELKVEIKTMITEAVKSEMKEKEEIVPDMSGKKDLINLLHAVKQAHTRTGRAQKALSGFIAIQTLKLDENGKGGANK